MRVKICGLTNLEDALIAAECGADALGFVFYPDSPRYITVDTACSIIKELPPLITTVGLFVNESLARIEHIMQECNLDTAQLHGHESPHTCSKISHRVIKAIRLGSQFNIAHLKDYSVSAFLVDAFAPGQLGGTGQTCDWEIATQIAMKYRTILAGGLNPENIVQAVQQVHPYGVDVSSGVEIEPGKKDHEKVAKFIRLAKESF